MKAGVGGVAHGGGVALPVEIAHPDGHGGGHAAVDHIEQLRGRERYLMGGKGRDAYPADKDCREREGGALHAELHGHGPAEGVEAAEVGTVDAPGGVAAAIDCIAAAPHEHGGKGHEHDYARHKGADAGAEQAHLGHAEGSVDEHVVAEDVEQVAAKDYEHGHARVGYSVVELLEGVEPAQKGQRRYVYQQIRAHVGQQLYGLAHAVEVEIEHCRDGEQYDGHDAVGGKAVAQHSADVFLLAAAEHGANDGRKAVGEAHGEDYDEGEHGGDKAGGGKLHHAVVAYHERVGKAEDNVAYLSDDDGHALRNKRTVVRRVSFQCEVHSLNSATL